MIGLIEDGFRTVHRVQPKRGEDIARGRFGLCRQLRLLLDRREHGGDL